MELKETTEMSLNNFTDWVALQRYFADCGCHFFTEVPTTLLVFSPFMRISIFAEFTEMTRYRFNKNKNLINILPL